METFAIEDLSFTYPTNELPAINNLTLTVGQGEFIAVCGKSGCGKTTLLRQMKTVLTPHGSRKGNIIFEGRLLESVEQRVQTSKIGYVMQNPDNQIVTDKVWHELAFGLESLGVDTSAIRLRVAEMASFFGIQTWFHRDVAELSGGQKQLLNLASIMAMQPSVLILDEPTSQLDPIAASEFLNTIFKINRDLGVTIILSEHRMEDVLPLCDRLLVMDNGRIIADGNPKIVGKRLKDINHEMFLAMPASMRIYAGVPNDLECPLTVREGSRWLDEVSKTTEFMPVVKRTPIINDVPIIELKDIWFKYEKNLPVVIKGLSLKINSGEIFAILGGNGTGKTTALSLISGIQRPYRGKLTIDGKNLNEISNDVKYGGLIAALPQNPQSIFVKKTVEQDLFEVFGGRKFSYQEREKRVGDIAELCEIENLLQSHPYDLSGGEQQRAALAKALLIQPKILLLDEPTKGLDAHFKQIFGNILQKLQAGGVTIVLVSHDIEFCASYAGRCAMFFDGCIVSEGISRDFFTGNSFYTTAANRIARKNIPEAVTVEDVILACGGKSKNPEKTIQPITTYSYYFSVKEDIRNRENNKVTDEKYEDNLLSDKRKIPHRTIIAAIMILLLVPLTIWFGIHYLNDRKYYIISMLVIFETMIPFAMVFENRKPQARELVMIAVLCAIAVAGRIVFFMVPQFKPVVAIVIISGLCFGGEAGFLVGAISGFVSNFFIGQSPITPWQMFAFGIIGFLAGVLFQKGMLSRNRAVLCIFGGLSAFFIYGGIMNPASVFSSAVIPTKELLALAYLRGIPFDLIHALSTVLFLAVAAKPMLEKLDRIKIKYGLVEK